MSKLKPCPFCGGEAELDWGSTYNVSEGMRQDGWVECKECEAGVEIVSIEDSKTTDDLIKKWNTRDDKQAKRQAITELLALHEQDRAKVNSQCDTLINMSTVEKYLEGLE